VGWGGVGWRRGSVQMSTESSASLTDVLGGSPQSLQAIVTIVPLL